MINSGAVRCLPPLHFSRQVCTGCQLGKQTRTKLPKEATFHATIILQLVHSDVCGPFRTTSLGGARYFVTFIDDFSRKTWIYFLTHKSQVLSKFQHLVKSLKTSTGQCIQTLRSDNGGEYMSTAFRDYCQSEGISREFAPPYTPQRNGVAERRNRSLLNITRSMLLDKGLPGHLWGEAVKAAGDLLNIRSTKRYPDKTPEELFSGKKPSISHLKIFGSPVYVRTTKPSQSKLEPRSDKCILLSFDSGSKAYRCYRPSTRKVFISRDILVDETSSFDLTSSSIREDASLDSTHAPTRQEEQLALLDPDTPMLSDAHVSPFSNALGDPLSPHSAHHSPSLSSTPSPAVSLEHRELSLPSSPTSLPSSPPPVPEPPRRPDPPRRSERVRCFPKHLHDFAAQIQLQILPNAHAAKLQTLPEVFEDSPEFLTFQQAHLHPHWQSAMQAEMDSIHQNQTWSLVPLPPGKKAISSKWVYKIKPATKDLPTRYKARLVARGFE